MLDSLIHTTVRKKKNKDLDTLKHEALRAARQLCYKDYILNAIREAANEGEITRAMIQGRSEMGD